METTMTEWNYKYMSIATYIGSMSKCAAKKVGCIIVKDGDNIVSSGVNGTPSNYTNCDSLFHKRNGKWYSAIATINPDYFITVGSTRMYPVTDTDLTHKEFTLNNEIHAEINAISKMAKDGISTKGCELYCNYSPCINCAKSIIAAGIKTVYYMDDFDDSVHVKEFLLKNQINVHQLFQNDKQL